MHTASNDEPRLFTSVTAEELARVDVEAPLAGCTSFEPHDLSNLYRLAVTTAELRQDQGSALSYALFQGLLKLHFKPGDRSEPYGAMYVSSEGRSLMVSDIPVGLADMLAELAPRLEHPVFRARVADIAWIVNRKNGSSAMLAIEAYCESVEQLRAGQLQHGYDNGDPTDHDVIERLRRACQISVVTKGKSPHPSRLLDLISSARADASARAYLHGFSGAADLDLDFGVTPPEDIAREAEALVNDIQPSPNGHLSLSLLEMAGQAYRQGNDKTNGDRLTVRAAEWCVGCADTFVNAPMLEAHWLTRAIGIYGRVRSEQVRRNELRKRLIDVQSRTMDDFKPVGSLIKIADIVERVQERTEGKSLSQVMRALILASKSPSPDKLKEEAAEATRGTLASLFSTQFLDSEGKVKFTSPGMSRMSQADNEATLRVQILQQESLRRAVTTASKIDPMRAIIHAQHGITTDVLLPLIEASPFVQPGYEFVFAQGFARWFGGDMVSAVSILMPQLENSLRYVLKNAGEDVSTMKTDGTQEDRSIQSLFDSMREPLEQILGKDIAYEIENLFLLRAGPGVRNGVAHGTFSTGHFYGNDAIYACWLIFQLCFLPLLTNWEEVEAYLDGV